MADGLVTLFFCGDVMLGRGVDQVLPHPGNPELREGAAGDARAYVRLAERAHGPIPRTAGFSWPWGDALAVLDHMAPDARVINLETSVTRSDGFAAGKPVHYRMSPDNVPAVTVVRPDACALANNHLLDFGHAGLLDTLDVLAGAGLRAVGAGHDLAQARQPAAVSVPGGGRAVIFACGAASGGIPPGWAATAARAGVDFLPALTSTAADGLIARIQAVKRSGDVVVVSLHWGSNWGYGVQPGQVRFARRLIDGGADLIYGHSSHHPRPVEVYRGRLILYGCGDAINDYEGISGHEQFRGDLRLLYFASLAADAGTLTALCMVPMQARRLRLRHASPADSQWMQAALQRISDRFGSRISHQANGVLTLQPPASDHARLPQHAPDGKRELPRVPE
jgi:poly-gamma-glutamate capsule biosynthesis protein CapA/YwtB (metallophosphatase superfamily)